MEQKNTYAKHMYMQRQHDLNRKPDDQFSLDLQYGGTMFDEVRSELSNNAQESAEQ